MDIKVTKRVFEEIDDFPETLYKYRSWTDDYHKSILSEQIVFMAKPTSFEDPLDCKLPKRYDLMNDQDILHKYYCFSQKDNPTWEEGQHKNFAQEWFNKSPMRDKSYLKQMEIDYFKKFDDRFGVLSLTENPKNNKMWTKYADEHKGFCVGFNSKTMFQSLSGGGIVTYHEQLPIIYHNDSHDVEHFKQVFSKEKKWEFEQEYRTFLFDIEPIASEARKKQLPKNCFTKIVFGANMTIEHQMQIRETCKNHNIKVAYFQSSLTTENEIELTEMP